MDNIFEKHGNVKMGVINTFLPNDTRISELYAKLSLVDEDIDKLIKQKESYIKLKKDYKQSIYKAIEEIRDKCTHTLPDGTYAKSKDKADLLLCVENGYERLSFCDICGGKYHNGSVAFDEEDFRKRVGFDEELKQEWTDNTEADKIAAETPANIEFNPNFKPSARDIVMSRVRIVNIEEEEEENEAYLNTEENF